jgi:hypothetical protein
MSPSKKLIAVQYEMSNHMDAMLRLFKAGAKITVVVRNPGFEDADVVIGSDDLDEAIAAIERMKKREPTFRVGEPL